MKKRFSWIALYTAMFAVSAAAIIMTCAAYGKSLIWSGDTYEQEYTVLLYIKRWLGSLFSGGGLKLVDLTLGQGLDVPTTLTYYGFTDPFTLISLLFPDEAMSDAYVVIAFARLYTAGLLLGFYLKLLGVRDKYALCCGCMVYAFCGFNIRMLGRFTYFINGGLYLILLLIAIERLLRSDKWLMYVLAAALGIYVNFYFAFMNTVCAIIYISARLVSEVRENGVRYSARKGFMLLGGYVLGMMLSCFLLLPVVKLYLSNGRMGIASGYDGSLLHYPLAYYLKLVYACFSTYDINVSYTTILCYAAPAFSACIAAALSAHKKILIPVCVCIAGLCVPAFGLFMNGGSYVTNRWIYILSVFMGCAYAFGIQHIADKRRLIGCLTAVFAVMLLAASLIVYKELNRQALIMLATAVLLAYLPQNNLKPVFAVLVLISCSLNGILVYAGFGWNVQSELLDTDVYSYMLDNTPAAAVEDDGVYRVDTFTSCDSHSSTFGYMGTGYYWSLIDKRTTAYASLLGSVGQRPLYRLYGTSSNASMAAVAAVKYHITPTEAWYVVPYGYSLSETEGRWSVYENRFALPLGYAYPQTLSYDKWLSLSAADRIYALTAYAITPDGDDSFESEVRELAITSSDITGGRIEGHPDSELSICFEAPGDSQVYLVFEGIKFNSSDTSEYGHYITVTSPAGKQVMTFAHSSNNFYFPNETQSLYLGSGENINSCTLTFDTDMLLDYSSVNVYAIPNSSYVANVNKLQDVGLTNVSIGTNSISGSITLSEACVLQIAVPYSEGWTACVDGQKAELTECGGMYMGLRLTAGTHEIELSYVTPWLKAGLMFSAAAIVIITGLLLIGRRRKKA